MRSGVFQHAVVAIILIASLLAPSGTCLQPAHKSVHGCCAPASDSGKTAQKNCCTVNAPLPAVSVATNLSGSAPMTVAREFIFLDGSSARGVLARLTATPPHSPPTGAFILRI
ncbi:MAG: hypothetical protein ABR905_17930 [Terracidiphilus sp.]